MADDDKQKDKPKAAQGPTFLDEYAGFITPGLAVIVAGLLYVLHGQDMISESATALAFALAVGTVCASVVWTGAHGAAKTAMDRNLGSLFAVLTLASSAGLTALAVTPGAPLAESDLHEVGQTLALPSGVDGAVRFLVHGDMAGEGDATINFELDGTEKPALGHLVRKIRTTTSRKGGRSSSISEVNSTFVDATLNGGGKTLTLKSLNGPLKGELHVAVYKNWLPAIAAYVLTISFILVAALVSVKKRWKDTAILAIGLAAAFGLVVNLNSTPDAAVQREIGALFLGFFLGGFGAYLAAWLLKKMLKDQGEKPLMA
ncbi:MAG: hypothetical protein U1E65_18170 [Myxococcota bacterium]